MSKEEFYNNWLDNFAEGIPENDMEKHVTSAGNLLWHVFSWELIDKDKFLEADEARVAYDRIDKNDVLYIDWFYDDETKDLTSELNTASALDEEVEVYVVSRDFSWTYIKTHESTCGPYFMMR